MVGDRRNCQYSTFVKTFSAPVFYALNNRTVFAKSQMSERRSNTICAVVESPDHHCGDDLVDKERKPLYVYWAVGIARLFEECTHYELPVTALITVNLTCICRGRRTGVDSPGCGRQHRLRSARCRQLSSLDVDLLLQQVRGLDS